MTGTRRPVAAGAILAAFAMSAATAAPAPARVVPQKGMAGVRIGWSEKRVRAKLGRPLKVRRGSNDFGPFTDLRFRRAIRVLFQGNGGATLISTHRGFERTREGVGVGSTERTVQRRLRTRNVRCETILRFRTCTIGKHLPGRTVTVFLIRRGKVVRVDVGIVID